MAGKAIQLAVLRPYLALGTPSEPVHALFQLHGLTDTPGANTEKRILAGIGGPARVLFDPVHWLDRMEGVEFEEKIGMAGSNHLVINEFLAGAKMAGKAFLCSADQIFRVKEAERHVLSVCLGP